MNGQQAKGKAISFCLLANIHEFSSEQKTKYIWIRYFFFLQKSLVCFVLAI